MKDIRNNVPFITSYGVESGGFEHSIPKTMKDKMDCSAIKFKHIIDDVIVSEYSLGSLSVYINYDRRGNILLGMDFLSKFCICMNISNITGEETLIMILRSEPDKSDFYKEIYRHFGFIDAAPQLAKSVRDIFR